MSDDRNLEPDPIKEQSRQGIGDSDLESFLAAVERSAEIDAQANYRVLDNSIKQSQMVIANLAAVRSASEGEESLLKLAKELSENPT